MNNKNRKRTKKLNKRKILILILIVLIILIICLVVMKKKLKTSIENPPVTPVNTDGWLGYKNTLSDVYEGNKNTLEINTKIKQVFEIYIPTISDKIAMLETENDISNFYKENTEYINDKLCIKNEKEFNKIINYLLDLNVDLEKLNYCIYLEGSYNQIGNEESLSFVIYYTEDKKITFDIIITGTYSDTNVELKLH